MKFQVLERAPKAAPTLEQLVRDYFDAVDDAKATGDGDQFTVSRGAALRRLERADEALRQAVTR